MFAKAASFFSKYFWRIFFLVTSPIILFIILYLIFRNTDGFNFYPQIVSVTAVFAPGDREMIKIGPNVNVESFNLPYTLFDDLSRKGQQKETQLGTYLKNRYAPLLKGNLSSDYFKAYSGTARWNTKSLSLVLGSLLLGRKDLYKKILKSQQTRDTPEFLEKVFNAWNCTNYNEIFYEYFSQNSVQKRIEEKEKVLKYLSENSGFNITSFLPAFAIYLRLRAAENLGLDLPAWTKPVYPEDLENITIQELEIRAGNDDLKKFAAGYLLQQLVADFKAKINDTSDKKVILYSTDEYNIAEMLITLDVFDSEFPTYGSCVMFELQKKMGSYFIKIYYETDLSKDPVPLKLPNCEELCPFENFEIALEKYFPPENYCELDGTLTLDVVIWDLDDLLL